MANDDWLEAPSWLSPEGQSFWNVYAPLLKESGALTPIDIPSFTSLTLAYSQMIKAAKTLEAEGLTAPGTGKERKTVKRHPAAMIWQTNEAAFRAIAAQFGLNPLARGKLKVSEPEPEDDGILD